MKEENERLKEKAKEVHFRLRRAFGEKLELSGRSLALELVHAILSQNTSSKNYNLAYERLVEKFPTPREIAAAKKSDIEEAIRPGGLSRQKSAVIKSVMRQIGKIDKTYSLEFIKNYTTERARAFLTSLHGVGPKTASVVLMFGAGRGVLPVDTHVLRTAKRIGLISIETGPEKAEKELEALFPSRWRPEVHLNLVRLGREICKARSTLCEICPVNPCCDLYASSLKKSSWDWIL